MISTLPFQIPVIFCIMNLDPSSMTGSHWVSILCTVMYYDSLCIHPSEKSTTRLTNTCKTDG
jgi:hypothetical protein